MLDKLAHQSQQILFGKYPYEESEKVMYVFFAVAFLFCFALLAGVILRELYFLINNMRSKNITMAGTIIDKKYIGSQTHSGSGVAIVPGSSSGIGIVSTSSTSSEQFILFIQSDIVYKIEVDMQQYYKSQIGEEVTFSNKIGGLNGKLLKSHL